jgi:hypothetical protein
MRGTRIVSINRVSGGITLDSDPASLPTEATAYTIERGRKGRAIRVRPPAVTLMDEVVAGPVGGCPDCGMMPSGRPLRESEDKTHRLCRCSKCGTDFAVSE